MPDETRRRLLRAIVAAPVVLSSPLLLGVAEGTDLAAAGGLRPTPACDDDDDPTPPQTEGPFFKPRSPKRTSLVEKGLGGTQLVVTGRVFTRSCRPVPNALLDFWQADDGGEYDNTGYRLRGHQFTNAQGVYRLETIVPGLYPGRARHIHVKVQAARRGILTTQLYFPDEGRNTQDRIFSPELLMQVKDVGARRDGRFDFILDIP